MLNGTRGRLLWALYAFLVPTVFLVMNLTILAYLRLWWVPGIRPAWAAVPGKLHQASTLPHQVQPIFEGQRACGDQRAELSHAMTGYKIRRLIPSGGFHSLQSRYTGRQDGRLCVDRIRQHIFRPFKAQLSQRDAKRFLSPRENLLGLGMCFKERLPHPHKLRALSGKEIRDSPHRAPPLLAQRQ